MREEREKEREKEREREREREGEKEREEAGLTSASVSPPTLSSRPERSGGAKSDSASSGTNRGNTTDGSEKSGGCALSL